MVFKVLTIIGASRIETTDYSTETLISDTIEVLNYVAKKFGDTTIIVVGHSMGGAIATKTTERVFTQKEKYPWHNVIKGITK